MSTPYGPGDSGGQPYDPRQNVPPPGQGYQYPQGYQNPQSYQGYQNPQGPWTGGTPAPPSEPPSEVQISFWLWIADVVVGVIGAVIGLALLSGVTDQILQASGGTQNPGVFASIVKGSIIAGAVFGIVVVALQVLFAVFMRRGRNWARIVLTVLGSLGVLFTIVGLFTSSTVSVNGQEVATRSGVSTVLSIIQALLIIGAIVMFFRPAANAYFEAHRR